MLSEEEYKKTLVMMWDSIGGSSKGDHFCSDAECNICPLVKICNSGSKIYKAFEYLKAVEEWGKEHPVITNGGRFLKENNLGILSMDTANVFIKNKSQGLIGIIDREWFNSEYHAPEGVKHEHI